MEIVEIKKNWYNKLLNRTELELVISYERSTPTREEVTKLISERFNASPDRIVIEHVASVFGSLKARVHAHIYDDVEHAMRFERKHILRRSGLIKEAVSKGGKTG